MKSESEYEKGASKPLNLTFVVFQINWRMTMKQFLLTLSLVLAGAMLNMAVADPAFAQEQPDVEVNVEDSDVEDNPDGEEGLRISLNIGDDDDSVDEKLKHAASKLGKVFGQEFGDEMEVHLDGLSDEEKQEVVNGLSNGFTLGADGSSDFSLGHALIPLTAIVMVFGLPVFILLLVLMFGHRKRRQKMDLIKTYLDAGKDVPEQILREFSGAGDNSLKRGVTPVAVGLGMIVASFILEDSTELAAFGLIPLFIGLARLVYWKYETKTENQTNY